MVRARQTVIGSCCECRKGVLAAGLGRHVVGWEQASPTPCVGNKCYVCMLNHTKIFCLTLCPAQSAHISNTVGSPVHVEPIVLSQRLNLAPVTRGRPRQRVLAATPSRLVGFEHNGSK